MKTNNAPADCDGTEDRSPQSPLVHDGPADRLAQPLVQHRLGTCLRHRARQEAKHRRLPEAEITAIVKSAAAGDQRSWDALVREFDGMIRAIARAHRLSDADAADVAQATWLRLLEHLDDLNQPSRVGGWLATTARRECLRVLRASQRYVLFAPEDSPERESLDPLPEDALLMDERDRAVRRSLARLRARDYALLRLLTADPHPSYQEISVALKMPIGSIGPTRARAFGRLRARLASDGTLALLAPEAVVVRSVVDDAPPRLPVLTADRNGEPPLGRERRARAKGRRSYPARHPAVAPARASLVGDSGRDRRKHDRGAQTQALRARDSMRHCRSPFIGGEEHKRQECTSSSVSCLHRHPRIDGRKPVQRIS